MALTPAQAAEVWELFKDSPLFAKWPNIQLQIPHLLDAITLNVGQTLFTPGDAPVHLFLVGRGGIRQTVVDDGRVWFQQDFGPGQYLGQQALFSGEYQSRAVATAETTLYRMSAANLRVALEWNANLRETLLQEERASRLRRTPLLRSLPDAYVRWLAQATEEVDIAEDASLPLGDKPGLWIVDLGQVAVTGPANPHASTWPRWRITSGNFLIAPSDNLRFGHNCVAESAIAGLPTHLYYLPAEDTDRLVSAFPDVGNIIRKPLDAAAILAGMELFRDLSDRQRQHLAQFCGWEFVPARQNITTQGNVGHSFVILREGAAIVTALDNQGRSRPRNYLGVGDGYGETSLLQGKPRDATVRAVTAQGLRGQPGLAGAELVILDRRDLQFAFADDRILWRPGIPLFDRSIQAKEEKQPFKWLDEGEAVIWRGRGLNLWFIIPEVSVILGAIMFWLVPKVLMVNDPNLWNTFEIAFLVLAGLFGVPLGTWVAVNYFDDYYVVTNRRVVRRDRQLLMFESRIEAPIDMVQDVTVKIDLYGQIFGFGDLMVRTAAKVGTVTFSHVPDPERVKAAIMGEKAEALAATRGKRKEILRRGLIDQLHLVLPVPERQRALGRDVLVPSRIGWWNRLRRRSAQLRRNQPGLLPGTRRREKPGWFVSLVERLPESWQQLLVGTQPPPPQPLPGQILWRKHWVNLLQRAGPPFAATLLMLALAIWLVFSPPQILDIRPSTWLLAWLLLFLAAAAWLGYQYLDYRNDIYVVTDNQIIDIEKKPLWLSADRREGGLDRVQTVFSQQKGFWANVLDYGDVIIRTAAADEGFTFEIVPHPKSVQAIVFQKLEAFRRRQDENRIKEYQQELIEGLDVYHQIREGR